MRRPAAAALAVLAALLSVCVVASAAVPAVGLPAAAQATAERLNMPQGRGFIGVRDEQELRLFQIVAAGLTQLSVATIENRTLPEPRTSAGSVSAAAATPPVGATPAQVRSAVASVLAAASIESEVLSTLGNPRKWT